MDAEPAKRHRGLIALVVVATVAVAVSYAPGASSNVHAWAYYAAFLLCQVLMVVAVRRIPAASRGPWKLMLLASVGWAFGETYTMIDMLRGVESWPSPSDFAYIIAYLPLTLGTLRLDSQKAGGGGRKRAGGPLLDAVIVTLSVATLTVVFLIRPMMTDNTQSLLVRVVSSLYPLIDVLLVYLVARLLGGERNRKPALIWLALAMLSTFAADTGMNIQSVTGSALDYSRVLDVLWLLFYLFLAFAALAAGRPVGPERRIAARPRRTAVDLGVTRLGVLTFAAMLPSLVIITYASWRSPGLTTCVQLGIGSAVLIALVAARIWGLIQQLRRQASLLDRLAATDQLTTVANRRTWDAEMARAMGRDEQGGVLLVALLDLDHFKQFNDSRGHQAGDELLRGAALAWQDAVGEDGLLARWGGEEFSVLLHAPDENAGLDRLDSLRGLVPQQQTVSMGVVRWDGRMSADDLMHAADLALYRAKNEGRNRLVLGSGTDRVPSPRAQTRVSDLERGLEVR